MVHQAAVALPASLSAVFDSSDDDDPPCCEALQPVLQTEGKATVPHPQDHTQQARHHPLVQAQFFRLADEYKEAGQAQ